MEDHIEANEAQVVSIDRYPGPRPYQEADSSLFFGRSSEVTELLDSIIVHQAILIHGESGLGKSSLINAGLIPRLRLENFVPILFRFKDEEISPVENILTDFASILPSLKLPDGLPKDHSLWYILKNYNASGQVPVLIFDQFEEFSVFGEADKAGFYRELIVLFTRVSVLLTTFIRETLEKEDQIMWYEPADFRLVISLRSDKLQVAEDLASHIPKLHRNRYKLQHIQANSARQLIVLPAMASPTETLTFNSKQFTIDQTVIDHILSVIGYEGDKIETTQMQMICQEIEAHVRALKLEREDEKIKITDGDFSLEKLKDIPKGFYGKQLASLKNSLSRREFDAVRELIEKRMLVEGQKTSVDWLSIKEFLIRQFPKHKLPVAAVAHSDEKVKSPEDVWLDDIIDKLLDLRILRALPYGERTFYEISHDTLIPGIMGELQALKDLQRRRRKIILRSLLIVINVGMLICGWVFVEKMYDNKAKAGALRADKLNDEALDSYASDDYVTAFRKLEKSYLEYGSARAETLLDSLVFPNFIGKEFSYSNKNTLIVSKDSLFQLFNIGSKYPVLLYSNADARWKNYQLSAGGKFIYYTSAIGTGRIIDVSNGKEFEPRVSPQGGPVTDYGFAANDGFLYYSQEKRYRFYSLPGNVQYNLAKLQRIDDLNPISILRFSADGKYAYVDKGDEKILLDVSVPGKRKIIPKSAIGFSFHSSLPIYYFVQDRKMLVVVNYKTGWSCKLILPKPSFINQTDERLIVRNPRSSGRISGTGVIPQYSYVINLKKSSVFTIPKKYYLSNILGISTEDYLLYKRDGAVRIFNALTKKDALLDSMITNCYTDSKKRLVYFNGKQGKLSVYDLNKDELKRVAGISTSMFTINKDRSRIAFKLDSVKGIGLLDLNTGKIKVLPLDGKINGFVGQYLELVPASNSGSYLHKLYEPDSIFLSSKAKAAYLKSTYVGVGP